MIMIKLSYNYSRMLSENKGEKEGKVTDALSQLSTLMKQIEEKSECLEANLRAFVSIYVRTNSLSEEVFMYKCQYQRALCQHEVISKLFSPEALKMGSMYILELFNLLLANTTQQNSLVYILAQPSLHEFLFHKFQLQTESSQAIEYYIQLLKTIIMKMSNGNPSLIKMFCNNRYASFPLLCQVCYLATQSPEELVRVTAKQCVLLLIHLLNEKRVGCGYLVEVQMAVFFYQITRQFISQKVDIQGMVRYIVDLISALQGNALSLKMLLNTFSINVILPLLKKLPLLLKVISTLSEVFKEHQQIQSLLYAEIKLILGKIITKYCFNKFLNGTYLTALRQKHNHEKVGHQQLMKYFNQRFTTLAAHLKEIEEYEEQKQNHYAVLNEWAEFNSSKEIRELKGDERKSIFRFFMPKPDPLDTYIKNVVQSAGLNFDHSSKIFLFKLQNNLSHSMALFFIEQIFLREQQQVSKSFQQYEVHFNDNKGSFELTSSFCDEISVMLVKVNSRNILINKEINRQQLGDLQFEYTFLRRLKLYLINNLTDFLLQAQVEHPPEEMCKIRGLIKKMEISRHLEKNTLQKLMWKIEQLQCQINELTFMREFKLLIRYVLHSYSDRLCNFDQGPLPEYMEDIICSSMMKFQFIAELIDPKIVDLQHFVENQWQHFLENKQDFRKLSFDQQQQNWWLMIKPHKKMKFQVKVRPDHHKEDIIAFDVLDPENVETLFQVERVNKLDLNDLNGDNKKRLSLLIEHLCSLREQLITKWIVQYFEVTYNHLSSLLTKRNKKSMILHNS